MEGREEALVREVELLRAALADTERERDEATAGHNEAVRLRIEACEYLAAARELVRRAAVFVNAVAGMAENKTPSLGWLADAAAAMPNRSIRLDKLDGKSLARAALVAGEQQESARGNHPGAPVGDPERLAAIAACPEPFWHETHRYCPVCPWTEADA